MANSCKMKHHQPMGPNGTRHMDSGYSTCERRESSDESESLNSATQLNKMKNQARTIIRIPTEKRSTVTETIQKPELCRLPSKSKGIQKQYGVHLNQFLKNLDIKRIKFSQLEELKPSEAVVGIYQHCQAIYRDSANFKELANDMFMRLSSSTNVDVKFWLDGIKNLKRFECAIYADWLFKTRKFEAEMKAISFRNIKERVIRDNFRAKRDQQVKKCQNLHEALHLAKQKREERRASEEKEIRNRNNFTTKLAHQKRRKAIRRQLAIKLRLRLLRQEQMDIHYFRTFTLKRDLVTLRKQRLENSLFHAIRVNFRRILFQKRQAEKEAQIKTKSSELIAKEARLESLKRLGRKRINLHSTDSEVRFTTNLRSKTTIAFRAKVSSRKAVKTGEATELHGYHDQTILEDQRLMAENILRKNGLLMRNKDVVEEVLKRIPAPRKSRRDAVSQVLLCND